MLLNIVDVVCCENPECRDFALVINGVRSQTYYCPTCGVISHARPADPSLAADRVRFAAYLHKLIDLEAQAGHRSL